MISLRRKREWVDMRVRVVVVMVVVDRAYDESYGCEREVGRIDV